MSGSLYPVVGHTDLCLRREVETKEGRVEVEPPCGDYVMNGERKRESVKTDYHNSGGEGKRGVS